MATVKTLKPLRDRARRMRREDTRAETRLWNALRDRKLGGWKWRRQVVIGPYIVDFYCDAGKLVVELDGGQHAEQVAYDARRTAYLERQDLRVMRFWNSAVLQNSDSVCLTILHALDGDRGAVGPG